MKKLLPIAVVIGVVGLWFSPWWWTGRNLAPLDVMHEMMQPWREGKDQAGLEQVKNHIVSDGVDQYLVYRKVAEQNFAREGYVGWSSLTYGGTAQYANTMALYDDWTMQLHRWFDFWTAWHLGLMGQIMLAAVGCFGWLRSRGIRGLWAACGALAYAGNSQFVTWIYHRWALGAFCWVPWILWAVEAYRKGNRHAWSGVPLAIGMAFLGGTLQHAALVALAVVGCWLAEILEFPRPSGFKNQWLNWGRITGRYACWGIIGSGLSGMMLLPCAAAFLESNRLGLHTGTVVNAANSIYPQGPLQPLFQLLSYPLQLFPSCFGRCDSLDLLKLFKSELFYVSYAGALVMAIGTLAVLRKRSRTDAKIWILMGMLLPLTPLVRWLYQRLFLLWILGAIVAFAQFMQEAPRQLRVRCWNLGSYFLGIAITGWLLVSAMLWMKPSLLGSLRAKLLTAADGSSYGFFKDWIILRVDRFLGDLFIWSGHQIVPLAALVLGWIGFRATAARKGAVRRCGRLLVTGMVVFEVTWFAAGWVNFVDPVARPLFPDTAETKLLKSAVGRDGRVTTLIHPTAHMAVTPFVPNLLSAYGIPIIGGYDSIVPDGMILPNESPGDAVRLGRYGVSHLITWPGNPAVPEDWRFVAKTDAMALYENPHRVARYLGWASDSEKDAFFQGQADGGITLAETTGMENQRQIEIPAAVRWVRLAENQASGWQYRWNQGPWQSVQRAPDASMLIPKPESSSCMHLDMRYKPPLRQTGWLLSGLSLLMTVTGAWVAIHRPQGRR